MTYCAICKLSFLRFVRDHDHSTGLIRGILCEFCNSHLGVYESKKFPRKSKKYMKWLVKYQDVIYHYLNSNLSSYSFIYSGKSNKFTNELGILSKLQYSLNPANIPYEEITTQPTS